MVDCVLCDVRAEAEENLNMEHVMQLYQCVPCEVRAEAEETIEHRV